MIRYFLITILAFSMCGFTAFAQDNPSETSWSDLIADSRSDADLVGVGGLVMKDGEIIDIAVAGEKQKETGYLIEPGEVWHIGSITKSMTATMIARLVEKGRLDWDDTVEDILGTKGIHKDWRPVTFRELLTHTSGAKPNFSRWANIFQPKTLEDTLKGRRKHVRKVLKKKPEHAPGSAFQYSNVGYTIAGYLAQVKTEKSWEALMQEEVFGPLNMKSAGFGPPKPKDENPIAWGHMRDTPMSPTGFIADNSPIGGPAGTLHMSLQDLAKYGQAHLSGLTEQYDYLSENSFRTLHTARLDNYAMGWMEQEGSQTFGTPIFWHNGSNTMWFALLVVVPDENLVYALATNSSNYSEAQSAFFDIIKAHYVQMSEAEN